MRDQAAAGPSARVRGVDVLRGLAMLGVIAIHAGPTADWTYHNDLVGRSVPIFLVLLGVTAQLWWQKQSRLGAHEGGRGGRGLAYLKATGRRLAVPYWTWLFAVLALGAFTGRLPESLGMWLLSPLGYVPWAGPTWFIAAIVLLSVVVPVLHVAMARVGPALLAMLGLAVTWYCHERALAIMALGRDVLPLPVGMKPFYFFWIFVPAYFWHVAAGMWLGRHRGRVSAALWSACALSLIWGFWAIRQPGLGKLTVNAVRAFMDVPLTMVLLAFAHSLSRFPLLGPALAFIGRCSWGMYLGHILVFSAFEASGQLFQFADLTTRWMYFIGLFGGGLLLTVLGRWVRTHLGRRFPILASHA